MLHPSWHPAAARGVGDVSGTKRGAALAGAGAGMMGLVRVENGAHAPRRACVPPGARGEGRWSTMKPVSIPRIFPCREPGSEKETCCHIISYHIISYHIISYHIISYVNAGSHSSHEFPAFFVSLFSFCFSL